MRIPRCPLCHVRLEMQEQYWRCPSCGFFFQVVRGKPGKPLWRVVKLLEGGGESSAEDKTMEEAFKQYLLSHGWTEEAYNRLSPEGKRLLYQRWMERVGLAHPPEEG